MTSHSLPKTSHPPCHAFSLTGPTSQHRTARTRAGTAGLWTRLQPSATLLSLSPGQSGPRVTRRPKLAAAANPQGAGPEDLGRGAEDIIRANPRLATPCSPESAGGQHHTVSSTKHHLSLMGDPTGDGDRGGRVGRPESRHVCSLPRVLSQQTFLRSSRIRSSPRCVPCRLCWEMGQAQRRGEDRRKPDGSHQTTFDLLPAPKPTITARVPSSSW